MTVAASRSGLTFAALALALILIYTGISAGEKLTWLMEVTPVIIIVPLLLAGAGDSAARRLRSRA